MGVAAVVVGGIHDLDLKLLLGGRDLGVAITGTEQVGLTLIITEGFGRIAMARRTFDLLTSKIGRRASCSGATQIRAGVIRPEVIVPLSERSMFNVQRSTEETGEVGGGLQVGDQIRVIREPYFGLICRVSALRTDLQLLATESKVRVLEAELDDGQHIIVPRANVELLEA